MTMTELLEEPATGTTPVSADVSTGPSPQTLAARRSASRTVAVWRVLTFALVILFVGGSLAAVSVVLGDYQTLQGRLIKARDQSTTLQSQLYAETLTAQKLYKQLLDNKIVPKANPTAVLKAGPIGPAGPAGKDATSSEILAEVEAYCAANDSCSGPAGAAGATGKSGSSGTTGPAGAAGVNGQNATDAQVAAAVSAYCAANNGCQGPAGTNGADGTDGTNGTNGTDGKDGSDGQPPLSWTYVDDLGATHTCSRADDFDASNPTYSCS